MPEPRYGIWLPVYGNCGAMHHPNEPLDASYARSKTLILLAEELGFTTALIAQHLMNPRDQQLDQLETWTTAAALAEATDRNALRRSRSGQANRFAQPPLADRLYQAQQTRS